MIGLKKRARERARDLGSPLGALNGTKLFVFPFESEKQKPLGPALLSLLSLALLRLPLFSLWFSFFSRLKEGRWFGNESCDLDIGLVPVHVSLYVRSIELFVLQ